MRSQNLIRWLKNSLGKSLKGIANSLSKNNIKGKEINSDLRDSCPTPVIGLEAVVLNSQTPVLTLIYRRAEN